jgi:hypothetical protein
MTTLTQPSRIQEASSQASEITELRAYDCARIECALVAGEIAVRLAADPDTVEKLPRELRDLVRQYVMDVSIADAALEAFQETLLHRALIASI